MTRRAIGTSRRPYQERLRRGSRRTKAQPLAASWAPEAGAPPAKRRRRGFLGTYGWRVYALPVLLVATVLVALNAAKPAGDGATAAASGTSGGASPSSTATSPSEVSIGEAPPGVKFNGKILSAELPNGGKIQEQGAGTWHVVPGVSDKVGTGGTLYDYTVEVEDGVDKSLDADFATMVQETLANPKSWIGGGKISVQRVDTTSSAKPDMHVRLTSQQTTRAKCGFDVPYDASCRIGDNVFINAARWERGAISFQGDMRTYRQYAINHEVGHRFGNNHVACPENGGLANVMMQQTFSVSNNDLAQIIGRNIQGGTQIPADGKVCKVNAWPFPLADQSGG
ncbi:DUF3152 domain-containing protein [Solihabitans fulvus]|uniref:DUF3152 domain-containing protein n=1 Tax=Solihabitans fulvus TaxID=1892852 RepID=UPI001CB764E6|nr:DUF3152 domain-containing protein [Solihabitans fulvus]